MTAPVGSQMTNDGGAHVTGRVTTVAAAVAMVAVVVMAAGSLMGHPVVGTAGLAVLFAVPLARNLAVLVLGRGRDRVLALVGVCLIVVVGVATFRHGGITSTLDRPSPALPTSSP